MASLNVAIPDLVRSTHAGQTQLEWIIDAYLLVFSVLLLPAGALGDRYGRRKALIGGLIIFGTASAVAMTASSANELICLRGLIGLGAAFVMPATLSTITGTFPAAERTRAVSVWAAVAGGSAILGLLCSGILLEWFSWQAAFAINVVLAGLALAGTIRFVPESSQPDAPALDKGGAFLAMVGLVAIVLSIIEAPDAGWLSTRTLGGLAFGLTALAGFVLFERRQRHPLLDPRLFANRRLSAGSLSICIQFFAFFGFTFVSLQYLEGVRGYSPLVAALAVLPLSATMMPAARLTPGLASRFGARTVCVTGLVLVATGLVIISRVGTDSPYLPMLIGLVPLGVGMGAAMTPATSAITEALPQAPHGRHRQHRHGRLPLQPATPRCPGPTGEPGPGLLRHCHPRRRFDGRPRPRRRRERYPHGAALRGRRRDPRGDLRRHPAGHQRPGPSTGRRGRRGPAELGRAADSAHPRPDPSSQPVWCGTRAHTWD
jgi:MFS family permease